MAIHSQVPSDSTPPSTPSRSVLSVLCVILILVLLLNVLLTSDFASISIRRLRSTTNSTTVSESTEDILRQLNVSVSTILEGLYNLSANGVMNTEEQGEMEGSLRWREDQVNYSAVWMSEIEIDVILRHLDPKEVSTYLEWGSGGSTLNFAPFATDRAFSIEHDTEWCSLMQAQLTELPKISYHCVPVEKGYKGWGAPGDLLREGTYEQFKEYIDRIDKLNVPSFDFVLDDGRARVPAAIKVLSYLKKGSVVVLHDAERIFRADRGYEKVWDFYDPIDSVGGHRRQGVVVMRRKKNLDHLEGNHAEVQRILDEYSKTQ